MDGFMVEFEKDFDFADRVKRFPNFANFPKTDRSDTYSPAPPSPYGPPAYHEPAPYHPPVGIDLAAMCGVRAHAHRAQMVPKMRTKSNAVV